jgi:hypothetical protein
LASGCVALVFACSVESNNNATNDAGASGSGSSSSGNVTEDSGSTTDAAKKDTGATGGECKSTDPFTAPPTKPATARANSCSDADLTALYAACGDDLAATFDSAECVTQRGTACGKCAMTDNDAAAWGPVKFSEAAKQSAANVDGCLRNLLGAECGAKYYAYNACLGNYCLECTGADRTSCLQGVVAAECKDVVPSAECLKSAQTATVTNTCFVKSSSDADYIALIKRLVKQSCQFTPTADAGAEGGTDAGTD